MHRTFNIHAIYIHVSTYEISPLSLLEATTSVPVAMINSDGQTAHLSAPHTMTPERDQHLQGYGGDLGPASPLSTKTAEPSVSKDTDDSSKASTVSGGSKRVAVQTPGWGFLKHPREEGKPPVFATAHFPCGCQPAQTHMPCESCCPDDRGLWCHR